MNFIKLYILRYKMGRAYTADNFGKTVDYARAYLSEKEDDVPSMWLLADCYLKMGKNDKAEEILIRLLSISPDHLESLKMLSRIYYDKEAYSEAYSCAKKVLDVIESKTSVDKMLEDLSSSKKFSWLAKNVQESLEDDKQNKDEWTRWALVFQKWYEKKEFKTH
jgi:Tfp pilus assembly protein PilF